MQLQLRGASTEESMSYGGTAVVLDSIAGWGNVSLLTDSLYLGPDCCSSHYKKALIVCAKSTVKYCEIP